MEMEKEPVFKLLQGHAALKIEHVAQKFRFNIYY